MAKMTTCPCGWVVISPQGEEDAVKHTAIHLKTHHPGIEVSSEEMRKKVLSV
jgi:predicted small metal-binding protein